MANGYDSQVTLGLVVDDSQLSKVRWPGDYTVKIKQEIDSSGLNKAMMLGDYTQTVTQVLKQDSSWKNLVLIGNHEAVTTLRLDNSQYLRQLAATPTGNMNFTAYAEMRTAGSEQVRAAIQLLSMLPTEFYVDGEFRGENVLAGLKKLGMESRNLEDVLAKLNTYATGGDKTAGNMLRALRESLNVNGVVNDVNKRIQEIQNSMTKKQFNAFSQNSGWQNVVNFMNEGVGIAKGGNIEDKFGWMMRWRDEMSKAFQQVSREAKIVSSGSYGIYGDAATYQRKLTEYQNKIAKVGEEYQKVRDIASKPISEGGGIDNIRKAMDAAREATKKTISEIEKLEGKLDVKKSRRYHDADNRELQEAIALYEKLQTERDKFDAKMAAAGMKSAQRGSRLATIDSYMNEVMGAMGGNNLRGFLDNRRFKAIRDQTSADVNRAIKNASTGMAHLRQQGENLIQMSHGKLAGLIPLKEAGVATAAQVKAIDDITAAINRLKTAMSGGKKADVIEALRNLSQTNRSSMAAIDAETKLRSAQAKAARLSSESANEYIKKLSAMEQGYGRNYNLVSQLGQEIAAVYSVQQARQFLRNIVEIGGQFEYQRASIANILNDVGKADVLFTRIKELALHSPFNTLKLDQAVKELSAFDIPYNQLYSKLKNIANISAGTGTDISRIILAYGHVKSAGYLEGMQRRQFTNANINIIGELAKLYREREKADVTRADIYKRIHDKKVTYEDVDEVFNRMTAAGGQFHNMQEAMADTTKGVWKNAGDAINHMYMDIEKNFSGVLKTTGLAVTQFAKTFSTLLPILLHVGTAMSALSLYRSASTVATGKDTATTIANARAYKVEQDAIYQLTRGLAGRKMVSQELTRYELKNLITAEALTRESALRALATRELTYAEGKRLVQLGLIKQAELDAIARSGRVKGAMMGMQNVIAGGFAKMGTAIKGFLTSIPQMMAMMFAFEAVTKAVGWALEAFGVDMNDKQKTRLQQMNDMSNGAAKSLREALSNTDKEDISKMTASQVTTLYEEMSTTLKDNVESADAILAKLSESKSGETFLQGQIRKAQELYDIMKGIADIEAGNGAGNNSKFNGWVEDANHWNTESYDENLKDYSKDFKKMYKAQAKLGNVNEVVMRKFTDAIKKSNNELKQIVDSSENIGQIFDKISKSPSAMQYVAENSTSKGVFGSIKESSSEIEAYLDKTRIAYSSYNTVMTQTREIVTSFLKDKGLWDNATNAPKESVKKMTADSKEFQEIMQNLRNYHLSIEGLEPEWAEIIRAQIAKETFNVPLHPTLKKDDLVGWKKEVVDVLGEGFKQMAISAESFFDFRKSAAKAVKEAQSAIKSAGQVVIGATFDVKLGQDFSKDIEELGQYFGEGKKGWTAFGVKFRGKQYIKQTDIDMLESYYKYALLMQGLFADNKAGTNYIDQQELDKGNNTKKKGDTTDQELKTWKAQMDAVDKLQNMYDKWWQVYGDKAADMLANDEAWKNVIAGLPADFDKAKVASREYWDEYRRGKIKAGIPADKNANKDERESALANALGKVNDDVLNKNKEQISRLLDAVERELDKRKGRLNIWDKVFDATLDGNLASKFAFGLEDADTDLDNLYLFDKSVSVIEEFDKKMERLGEKHTFASLSEMSEEAISGLGDTVKKEFQSATKAVEDAKNAQKEQIAGIIGNYVDVADKLVIERKKAQREIDLLQVAIDNGMVDKDYGEETKRRIMATVNKRELEASYEYMQFFNAAEGVYRREFESIGNSIRDGIVKQMAAGIIEAKDYLEQLNKIDDILEKNRKAMKNENGVRKFFNVGSDLKTRLQNEASLGRSMVNEGKDAIMGTAWFKGLHDVYKDAILKAIDKGTFTGVTPGSNATAADIETIKEAVKKIVGGNKKEGRAKRSLDSLGDTNDIVNVLNSALAGMSQTVDNLNTLFGDLGIGINTMLSSFEDGASVFAKAASGDYVGAIFGLVNMPLKILGEIKKEKKENYEKMLRAMDASLSTAKNAIDYDMQDSWGLSSSASYSTKAMMLEVNRIQKFTKNFSYSVEDLLASGDKLYESIADKDLYAAQYETLTKDMESKRKKYLDELSKDKDYDAEQMEDAKQKYLESLHELNKYAEDTLKNIFGIDFHSWAGTLTDALFTAFENGEDAAYAWQKTVDNIVRDVAKNMVQKLFIEKEMEKVYDKYLGYDAEKGTHGVWRTESGGINMPTADQVKNEMRNDIANILTPEMLAATQAFVDGVRDATPYADSDGGGSLTKITSGITEEQGSVIAGYVNAINGNVSAMRSIADAQLSQLNVIAGHTAFIAAHIERMAQCTEHLGLLSDVVNGTKAFTMK